VGSVFCGGIVAGRSVVDAEEPPTISKLRIGEGGDAH
jgi:hypothetical protein